MYVVTRKLIPLILILITASASKEKGPQLFLIGDSISIHYDSYLEKYLKGFVEFDRKRGNGEEDENLDIPKGPNGGDSGMVLAYLKKIIKDPGFNPDYLLLNCGLHDIKRNASTNEIQVDKNDYKKNLKSILKLTQENQIKLIWINTTPVVDSIHNARQGFKRYAADLKTHNKIAEEIFKKAGVPIIDLYGFTEKLGTDKFIDHVHYNEEARKLQAAYIAGAVKAYVE